MRRLAIRQAGRLLAGLMILLAVCTAATPASASAHRAGSGATAVARSRVAADVLMHSYDPVKAWWPSSWWNSAVALQTVGDYMQRTGDRRFLPQLDNTFEKDKGPFPPGVLSGDPLLGNFTSRAIDDSEWWGLTWVEAYDLTGNRKYLDMATTIASYAYGYWDPGTCGGGVWWNAEKTYKNAVTNGLFIRLTAELHNRIPGDRTWLARATTAWNWFTGSGMINSSGLVNDGLTDSCQSNGQTVWSYNQGLAIGAGLELWRATHDRSVLATARRLADAAIASPSLVDNDVLHESCDATDRTCDDNGKQFKGIFMRYLMDAADTTHDPRYTRFVQRQAASIWTADRNAGDQLGERWSGPTSDAAPNAFDWRTQASALSALIAAVPRPAPRWSLSATLSPAMPVVIPAASKPTRLALTLTVLATSPGPAPMNVRVGTAGPAGWTVTAAHDSIALHPNGSADPARGSIPMTVQVPADAVDGHHRVTATVRAGPGLTFRATADILVTHTIDFDTGTAAELTWMFDADGSQSNGVRNRFADNDHYFVYKFPLPSDTSRASATLAIDNEFLVQVSPDGTQWTTVLKEDRQIHDGSNKADRTIDLTPYLGPDKAVYVRVSDAFPQDGWGGRISHVAVDFG
ncbi:hypothetical protein Athai_47770 [Actinocatenispora thailandica]|uniref:Alpha-galactosidase NEW3 domain-containing protein n=2 Tax=Actinocatenispora thailandica TaxID=227318 RepID=A0A7R7DSX6_9ACTN|nr:glycoside hydrolase family 76 protein [Actinocatenispora thailandica]BCJ37274.1 hypothetical protein Athai_47770 [Actinocatenispora thailandica]